MMPDLKANMSEGARILITQPRFERLERFVPEKSKLELLSLYQRAWTKAGVPCSFNQANKKIESFDLSETFVVKDDDGIIRASIHTVPVQASGMVELAHDYSTYQSVKKKVNYRDCISHQNREMLLTGFVFL